MIITAFVDEATSLVTWHTCILLPLSLACFFSYSFLPIYLIPLRVLFSLRFLMFLSLLLLLSFHRARSQLQLPQLILAVFSPTYFFKYPYRLFLLEQVLLTRRCNTVYYFFPLQSVTLFSSLQRLKCGRQTRCFTLPTVVSALGRTGSWLQAGDDSIIFGLTLQRLCRDEEVDARLPCDW